MKKFIPVKEFARLTNRLPNHIYMLITRGNKYRKLRAEKIKGKWMVLREELNEYPFTKDTLIINTFKKDIESLEERVKRLEAK